MTADPWLAARESEIKELEPQLICCPLTEDPPPGHEAPCNALTPAMVREMLYARTGIRGWRVRIVSVNLLEVLPPTVPERMR